MKHNFIHKNIDAKTMIYCSICGYDYHDFITDKFDDKNFFDIFTAHVNHMQNIFSRTMPSCDEVMMDKVLGNE